MEAMKRGRHTSIFLERRGELELFVESVSSVMELVEEDCEGGRAVRSCEGVGV